MLNVTNLIGFGVGSSGALPVAVTFIDNTVITANTLAGSSRNIAVSFGTADAARQLITVVGIRWSAADPQNDIDNVTIGGVSATRLVTTGAGNRSQCAIFMADVPTGTSGNVVVPNPTGAGNATSMGCSVYSSSGLSYTPLDTATGTTTTTSAVTLSADTTDNCIAVAGVQHERNLAVTFTWAGLTEDEDIFIESDSHFTSASATIISASTPLVITATPSNAPSGTTQGASCVLGPV